MSTQNLTAGSDYVGLFSNITLTCLVIFCVENITHQSNLKETNCTVFPIRCNKIVTWGL